MRNTQLTETDFRRCIDERFAGRLEQGSHTPDSLACGLEAYSQAIGEAWTDDPVRLRMWDIRPLNDIPVSQSICTRHIVPVIIAYQGSRDWSGARQRRVATRLVILTVNRLISHLPGLPAEVRQQCRAADTLALAGAAGAAEAAAWAAAWAAEAAAWAERAAGRAARERVFVTACALSLEAVAE